MTHKFLDRNPIPDLVQLGYTWRQAAFLYLVGRSSGFFLGRQYLRFLERKRGAVVQQLVQKAMAIRHIETLDYGQRRHLHHLKSRTFYRLLGEEESQSWHTRGDQEIKTKLMILDYVLERRGAPFLCSPREKVELLNELFPHPNPTHAGSTSQQADMALPMDEPIRDRFPLFVGKRQREEGVTLEFTYFDHGTRTLTHFARHLRANCALWSRLRQFQLIYVALTSSNFRAAQHAFQNQFPSGEITARLMPCGRDHLIAYFGVRRLWDQNHPGFTPVDLRVLKQGESCYRLPEHEALREAWLRGRLDEQLTRICGETRTTASLVFHLLREKYPIFGYQYPGKATEGAAESPVGAFSVCQSSAYVNQ